MLKDSEGNEAWPVRPTLAIVWGLMWGGRKDWRVGNQCGGLTRDNGGVCQDRAIEEHLSADHAAERPG